KGRPVVLVVGMLANKDAEGVLRLLAPTLSRAIAVPVEGHDSHAPAQLASLAEDFGVAASVAPDLASALELVAG
ncbi:hypothetical protein NY486_04625, partial [Enterobacter hormaechei]|nr:hypothetical protein [Enterobacter hormaechei]